MGIYQSGLMRDLDENARMCRHFPEAPSDELNPAKQSANKSLFEQKYSNLRN